MWGRFFHWLGTPFRTLFDPEGRRAWAVMLMAGCGVSMSVYAGFSLFLVRRNPNYAFYLGCGALLLIAIVITGFASLITKRDIDVNALGIKFKVSDQQVQEIAAAVVQATPTPPPAVAPIVVVAPPPPPPA